MLLTFCKGGEISPNLVTLSAGRIFSVIGQTSSLSNKWRLYLQQMKLRDDERRKGERTHLNVLKSMIKMMITAMMTTMIDTVERIFSIFLFLDHSTLEAVDVVVVVSLVRSPAVQIIQLRPIANADV